ncbi:hypothetical protein CHS0354_036843 [Potamilus streckersoni]|uniref:Uncharacterized protein n=1 Tax=Potamilus streckersoni TaxID=2493646 RepID=A0AAE0S0F5_9BIVA|nr:hypothetical protein CHS0354_036843 [Potamilus streckersoni]
MQSVQGVCFSGEDTNKSGTDYGTMEGTYINTNDGENSKQKNEHIDLYLTSMIEKYLPSPIPSSGPDLSPVSSCEPESKNYFKDDSAIDHTEKTVVNITDHM